MNDISKLREKIQKKQIEKDGMRLLFNYYRQKENTQLANYCEEQYKKLCKTCAKLVEKYYNLLHSNNESYKQLSLFNYNNNNNNNI